MLFSRILTLFSKQEKAIPFAYTNLRWTLFYIAQVLRFRRILVLIKPKKGTREEPM